MKIDATGLHFKELNQLVRNCADAMVTIEHCIGQRYIGSGLSEKNITIHGIPGNALGAYLNGANITVHGNGQDAIGDTMNDGTIVIHGSSGDATGYAMRGGMIMVKGNAGYRAGIHMKAYQDKVPVLVIGGVAGSFLGEYQAGGTIVVLGLNNNEQRPIAGYFCGTGMHGGKIYLRCDQLPATLPKQVVSRIASEEDMKQIMPYLDLYCDTFSNDKAEILQQSFYILEPNTQNPYKQLYTHN